MEKYIANCPELYGSKEEIIQGYSYSSAAEFYIKSKEATYREYGEEYVTVHVKKEDEDEWKKYRVKGKLVFFADDVE